MQHNLALTSSRARWLTLLAGLGPGLIVMLADTDAGSIITAAQSGSVWGYKLLPLQLLLVPVLFVVQELTVRLGLVTGRGHGELIRERFGKGWAWLSAGTLVVACIGALISELSGLAGVGQLFGVPAWQTVGLVVACIVIMGLTHSYRSIERIAVTFGLFELAFLYIAFASHPDVTAIQSDLASIPFFDQGYLYLVTANIGAVIMPWMVFFQQSAVVEKGMGVRHLKLARWETAIGALVTQLVMAAVLVATAATLGQSGDHAELNDVQQISQTLVPFLGVTLGKLVFVFGISGAALVATIVVSLTAAWGVGEVAGYRRSLADHPLQAPWFYGIFAACLLAGGVLVASGVNLVSLSVFVEVINALLLPIVLGFLYLLAIKALPEPYKLKGAYAWIAGLVMAVTAGFGIFSGIASLF
jgi:NRAMP (natural resistance-associated macrophage protein)-like metal ion transporter